MSPEDARARQAEVVDASPNLFVRACPGAGKTRTVVNRYLRVADQVTPRGAAVISFTNRAAEEVTRRCAQIGRPNLVQFPHFVGTFDRFIGTYIVRPFGQLGGPVRIVDSWTSLDVTIAGTGGIPVSLDHFEISPQGVVRFEPRGSDPDLQGPHRSRRESVAIARLRELRNNGYLTCDDARTFAARLVQDNPLVAALLRERFAEVIVDEAQDCSTLELDLLSYLREAGLPIVVVCDPHQSIYQWRDANPERFAQFTRPLNSIELSGNWRSTQAICLLAATLKNGPADHPVGPHRDDETPIHVLRYESHPSPALGSRFLEILDGLSLKPADGIVLAHAARPAARAAGASFKLMNGNVGVLAIGSARVADPRIDPAKRHREFDRLQRLVLRYLRIETEGHSTERAAALAEVDPDWLRTRTFELARSTSVLSHDMAASDWIGAVRQTLGLIDASTDRQTVALGTFLRTPPNSGDKTIGQVIGVQSASIAVTHSSIHKAKGTESPGVLVVIPPDRAPSTRTQELVAAWEATEELEARRVLYVGVTRAQRVCVLAVPNGVGDRIAALLHKADVPFVVSMV